MKFDIIKIDVWWKLVLVLGLIFCVGAVVFEIDTVNPKHLLGLGLGMIIVGISYWISLKFHHQYYNRGILSTPIIRHNWVSILLLIIGIGLILLFGFLLIKELI